MSLKLYGHSLSPCTQRVRIALFEKGIAFEDEKVDLPAGEHKKPEYKKLQPFGVVPAIDDDGYLLYESRAIVRYIEAKYKGSGTELVPTDLKAYGIAEQGAYLESQSFEPPATMLLRELVFRKYANPDYVPDEKVIGEAREKIIKVVQIYEEILSKQKYIGGDTFTIADVYHLPYLGLFNKIGKLEKLYDGLPNVERWCKEICERESFKKATGG